MKRREFLISLAGLAACGGGGGGGGPAIRPPPPIVPPIVPDVLGPLGRPLGIVTHHLDGRSLHRIREMQVRQIRFTIYWHEWRESPEYRAEMAAQMAGTQHLDRLLVLHGNGENLDDYVQFVSEVYAMEPNAQFQFWNEVDAENSPGNGWRFFEGDAQRYAAWLAVAKDVVGGRVVGPGISATADEDTMREWVTALDPHVEAHCLHCYGFTLDMPYRDQLAKARPHSAKPMWCTELGMEEAVVPADHELTWPTAQADSIRRCAPYYAYDRTYVFVLDNGQGTEHSITPETEAWIAMWNGLNSPPRTAPISQIIA